MPPPVQPADSSDSVSSAACVGAPRLVPPTLFHQRFGSDGTVSSTAMPHAGSPSDAMSGTSRLPSGAFARSLCCHAGNGVRVDWPPPDPDHAVAVEGVDGSGSVVPPTATAYAEDAG